MNRTLDQLVKGIIPENEVPAIPIHGITAHSAQVNPGHLYIAIHGTNLDGHDFIPQAIDNGAVAIITNGRDVGQLPVPQIKVVNPRRAASFTAAEYYGHPSKEMTMVGITGTNGKTTTAGLISAILKAAGEKVAQIGTLGTVAEGYPQEKTLTTPDPIALHKVLFDLRQDGFTHIVMEASSHAIDQSRVADVDFNYTVFTNLSPEHLDYHGTMADYFQAKLKLFTALPPTATAIVNMETDYGQAISDNCAVPVVATALAKTGDVFFKDYQISLTGIHGTIQAGEITYTVDSSLIGKFNAENILCATATGNAMGLTQEAIKNGLKQCASIPGRMESFALRSGATALIDYAHTPDAYDKVLSTIKDMVVEPGVLHIVFGCGGDRDRTKRAKMAASAEQFGYYCYVTPDNPRTEELAVITADIVSGFRANEYAVFDQRSAGLRQALDRAAENDVVVVLGKGREDYQEINGKQMSYSDLEIINEYRDAH
jgi:UDP-N-acetylmuramoyl-L-alanyl-D-glutamate--2,6-diaminopimelate ligase